MANMRFSELTTASSLTDSDIFALAKLDGSSESGYMSYKATLTAIAIYLNKLAVYSSDLDTNDKHIIGAINELKRLISLIPTFNIVKVQVLPTEDISDTTIYLVPSSDPQTQNVYDEFIHIDNAWEQVGSTAIDLSDYYTKAQIDGFLATKANTADVTAGLALKENKADMQTDVKEIIESCYEEKTVTGNPITIKTISGSNAKSLTVSMNPIQDLHGYDYPWVGGAGKNKIPLTLANLKSINTTGTWNGNDYTYSGITYTVNLDNGGNVVSITASGTASANSSFYIVSMGASTLLDYLTNGTNYIVNGCTGGSSSTYLVQIQANSAWYVNSDGDTPFTYTSGNTDRCRIYVASGATVNNQLFKPMVRLVTVTDATFAPYSNICPISGRTEASVTRTAGEDVETKTHQYSETIYGGVDDFVNGGLQITDAKFNVNGTETGWSADIPYSTQSYNRFVCTGIPSLGVTSNTEFEGITNLLIHTKSSQGINNGFRLRYVNGTNRLDIFTDAFDSLSALQAYLSSEPLQVCYELATPTTTETSAEEIELLKGQNVLSTNADDMELSYQEIPDITPLVQYVQTLEARIKALEEAE